jgi:hypothetical protein
MGFKGNATALTINHQTYLDHSPLSRAYSRDRGSIGRSDPIRIEGQRPQHGWRLSSHKKRTARQGLAGRSLL